MNEVPPDAKKELESFHDDVAQRADVSQVIADATKGGNVRHGGEFQIGDFGFGNSPQRAVPVEHVHGVVEEIAPNFHWT